MTRHFDRKKFSREKKRAAGKRGLTVLYIGNGKGKTTAAIGLAVRAHGAGLKPVFLQFIKSERWQSYERQALAKLGIPVHILGSGFVGILDDQYPLAWHKKTAKAALATTRRMMRSGAYDVVIADELASAVDEGLLNIQDVLALIKAKPARVHLVLTGHTSYPKLIAACDLVTEMKNIKHPYYTEGLLAQRGIDF